MKKNSHSIYLRLKTEEAIVLNNLAAEAGTTVTNYARELLKTGIAWQTGEVLIKASSIDDIVREVMDERLKKLENRLAGLLVKDIIASLESKGIGLNVLRQVLYMRNLPEEEINRKIAIIKNTVYDSAKERAGNKKE